MLGHVILRLHRKAPVLAIGTINAFLCDFNRMLQLLRPVRCVFASKRCPAMRVPLQTRLGVAAKLGFKAHPHMLRHACGYKLANDGHPTTEPCRTILGIATSSTRCVTPSSRASPVQKSLALTDYRGAGSTPAAKARVHVRSTGICFSRPFCVFPPPPPPPPFAFKQGSTDGAMRSGKRSKLN